MCLNNIAEGYVAKMENASFRWSGGIFPFNSLDPFINSSSNIARYMFKR
jgi:hypothetical protein